MKSTLKTILRVLCIIWLIALSILMLPKIFSYSPNMSYMLGSLIGYLLGASPGIYAIKIMFFSKNKEIKGI